MNREDINYRLVVDSTPALVFSARPDGYVDYFNQSLGVTLSTPEQDRYGADTKYQRGPHHRSARRLHETLDEPAVYASAGNPGHELAQALRRHIGTQ